MFGLPRKKGDAMVPYRHITSIPHPKSACSVCSNFAHTSVRFAMPMSLKYVTNIRNLKNIEITQPIYVFGLGTTGFVSNGHYGAL